MSATLSRSAHPWVASHRLLLALAAFAVALAATVLIIAMASAGSSPSSSFQAPAHLETGMQNQAPLDNLNRTRVDNLNRTRIDTQKSCLFRMLTAC